MATRALVNMSVLLGMNLDGLRSGIDKAMRDLNRFGRQAERLGKDLTLGLTVPITAFGVDTMRAAGNFEAAMNSVQANTRAAADEFEKLENLARNLGATTQFSATEAADGIDVLARNGLRVEQILDGAAEASLRLAAATRTDLANAADIATDVMAQFGIEAQNMADAVDTIAGTVLNSKFGIDDIRLAIGQAGGVAGKVGVSFEDFATSIAATSSAFASGSDAGTSFKNFLVRLNPASKEAAKLMQQLNLNFFNADGTMKSMSEIAGELQRAFRGLSEEQRLNAASTIFGTDAMRTALTLADNGSANFDKLAASIGNVSAQEQAATLMRGLNGGLKELGSAYESLQIAIAKSGLLEFAEGFVRAGAQLLRQLSQLDPAFLKIATAVAGVAAAIGPLLLLMGKLATIGPTVFATISTGFTLLTGPVGIAIAAIAAAVVAIIAYWDEIKAYFTTGGGSAFWERVQEIVSRVMDRVVMVIDKAVSLGIALWREFGSTSTGIVNRQFGTLLTVFESVFEQILNILDLFTALFTGDIEGVGDALINIFLTAFKVVFNIVNTTVTSIISVISKLASYIPGVGDDISNGLNKAVSFLDNFSNVANAGFDSMRKGADATSESVKSLGDDFKKLTGSIVEPTNQTATTAPAGGGVGGIASASGSGAMAASPQLQALPAVLGDIFAERQVPQWVSEMAEMMGTQLAPALVTAQEKFNGVLSISDTIKLKFEEIGESVGTLGENLKNSFVQGEQGIKEFGKTLANTARTTVKALIAEGITAAIANTLKGPTGALGPIGVGIAAAAGAAAAALFNSAIPAFADGGIVSGPTLGLMGEYPGARSNPEVIAPLSKLQKMMGNGGNIQVEVTGQISGSDLKLVMEKQNRKDGFRY